MTAKKKPQDPQAQPEPQPLPDALWQRLLGRIREMHASAFVLLRSCPVATVEAGLYPVLTIECPRDFVFDELGKHLRILHFAARDVLDAHDIIVWRRLAPDAKCTRLSDEEWVERSAARPRLAVNAGVALPPGRLTRPPTDPLADPLNGA
jgi:hypothetical protein